jgi:hypothetical protein
VVVVMAGADPLRFPCLPARTDGYETDRIIRISVHFV